MACNCATNDQLEKLYKEFGQKRQLAKGDGFLFRIKNFFTTTGVVICLILLLPYILFYTFRHGVFGDHKISLAHFFGFRNKITKENV
jgi:hypothetical protein